MCFTNFMAFWFSWISSGEISKSFTVHRIWRDTNFHLKKSMISAGLFQIFEFVFVEKLIRQMSLKNELKLSQNIS